MLQVKTNFTGFKVSAKRVTALISAAALSLLGLVATNTAANAAPTPSQLFVGGPSGSTSECSIIDDIGVFSDSLHTTEVTSISGTSGIVTITNVCSDYAITYQLGTTTGQLPGTSFSNGERSFTSATFMNSGTFLVYRCAQSDVNPGSSGTCNESKEQASSIPASITGGGGAGGGGGPESELFPVGGATVSGTFSINSKITVTPNTWSLTSGGSAVTATSRFYWYACDTALSASTTDFMDVDCFDSQPAQVLANGTSVGTTNGPNQSFTGSSLTITQSLLTALTGKHLMVVIVGSTGTLPSSIFGELFMKSCGPITSGLACSSAFGTPAVAKKTPKAATVATKVKIGKTFAIALHASKGTASKGANADGLSAVVSVSSASKKYCSVTKIVKSGKIIGYTIKGLKAGKCSVAVAISGSSTFNASTKTTVVTVSK